MTSSAFNNVDRASRPAPHFRILDILPPSGAMLYPFVLLAFHHAVGSPGTSPDAGHVALAAMLLLVAFAVPVLGLVCASRAEIPPSVRRLAYGVVVAPTFYVFLGVLQAMARSPVPDEVIWSIGWLAVTTWALAARRDAGSSQPPTTLGRWRVAHGIAGAVVLLYVLFHVTNHLFGLVGPATHAQVMAIGRTVYRNRVVEPLLVATLLFQIGSGFLLAWRWSAAPVGFHRLIQVASGFYLSAFILGHMNSVFFYARRFLGIPTDWAFATGAPAGLIHDPWNIRLLPHYALGVFLVLTHLVSGARIVLLAHGADREIADRLWACCVALSALIATLIIAAMCGVRIHAF